MLECQKTEAGNIGEINLELKISSAHIFPDT